MFKIIYIRLISTILVVSMLTSVTAVFAENVAIETVESTITVSERTAEPTLEPLSEEDVIGQMNTVSDAVSINSVTVNATNASYAESANAALINDVEIVERAIEEPMFDIFNNSLMRKYINSVAMGYEKETNLLHEYYIQMYGEIEDADVYLLSYFTEDEAQSTTLASPYRYLDKMKLFLICFIENESISDNVKADILDMIKNGYSIQRALLIYLSCRELTENNVDSLYEVESTIEVIDESEELAVIATETPMLEMTVGDEILERNNEILVWENELLEYAQENEMAMLSVENLPASAEQLWIDAKLQEKHFDTTSGNVSIEEKMGGLTYSRNDVSVPLRGGMKLEFPVRYDSQEAYALYFGCSHNNVYTGPKSITYEYSNIISPLGVGWDYNITSMENGIIQLSDGRTIQIKSNTYEINEYTGGPVYSDISFEYDEDENKYYVQYLDGAQEYFDRLSFQQNTKYYITKKVSKYGDIIYYEYDENDATKLVRVYCSNDTNMEINISYNANEVVVERPDGSIVKYIQEPITLTYGEDFSGGLRTIDTYVITKVIEGDSYGETITTFEYTSFDSKYMDEVAFSTSYGADYTYESRAYALMTEVSELLSGETVNYSYAEGKEYSYRILPCIEKVSRVEGDDRTTYEYDYDWVRGEGTNKKSTTIKRRLDEVITEITFDTEYTDEESNGYKAQITDVKIINGTSEILKQHTETVYIPSKKHIPYFIISKIYNVNGNYITYKQSYEYNDQDKITLYVETVDEIEKNRVINTYDDDRFCSLLRSDTKNSSGEIIQSKESRYTTTGDIIYETVYDYNNKADDFVEIYYNRDLFGNVTSIRTMNVFGQASSIYYEYAAQYNYAVPTKIYTTKNGVVIFEKSMEYNPLTNMKISETDGCGNIERFTYDSRGRLVEQTHPDNSSFRYDYRESEHSVWEINENGYLIDYIYMSNTFRRIKEAVDGNYASTVKTIKELDLDSRGRPFRIYDAENNFTDIYYDVFDRQTKLTTYVGDDAEAAVTEAKYFDVFLEGNNKYSMTMIINPEDKVSCKYYDVYGRLVKTTVITNPATLLAYDLDSLVQLPSDVQFVTVQTLLYDDLDRIIQSTDGENRKTVYTYDVVGNVLSVTQGNNSELYVSYEYNALGDVIKMSQGSTNPHITIYDYDDAGRLVKTTDPMTFTEEYEYDKAGNVTRSKDKNGVWTTNTYDSRNRLISMSKNGKTISYTYDSVGNMLTQTDENGIISYEYNLDGTLKKKTMPDGKSITYNEYDDNKRLLKMSDYFGNTTAYTYDGTGNILTVAETYLGNTSAKTTSYTYNLDGSLSFVSIPNSMTTSYTYDYAGRVTYINNNSPYTSAKSTHAYVYDNANNIIQATETMFGHDTVVTTYTYDSVNRLIEEQGGAVWGEYFYNQYNNLISAGGNDDRSYIYDANNRLVRIDDYYMPGETADGEVYDDWETYYTYDNNGNLLSSSKNSAPDCGDYVSNQKTYTYDVWGRLTGYTDSLGESGAYTYYPDGLRRSKTVGSNTYQYYYDGAYVVNETKNGSNFATNVYGVDGPISRQYGGYEHYYFKNVHGDVIFAFTSGKWRSSEYSYGAYGNEGVTYDYFSANPNPIRYSGEYFDTESGMTYLRARYYDPYQRRFISEDPHWNVNNMIYGDKEYKVGEIKISDMSAITQSSNLYAYCMNNPMKFVDPSGESVSGAAFLAVVGSCAVDGLITGGIYKWNGEPFGAGFINGFVSCLGTEAGTVIGVKTGHPYIGVIIGNTIGEAAGSMVEVLVRNEIYGDKITIDEAAETAAKAAASGILSGVGSSYVKYAIELADKAGSAAQTLMKYDEKFGKAMNKFFDTLSTILSAQ